MYLKSVPFSSKCVANECLKVCIDPSVVTPAFVFALCNIFLRLVAEYLPPLCPLNKYSLLNKPYCFLIIRNLRKTCPSVRVDGSVSKSIKWQILTIIAMYLLRLLLYPE